jgi:hypothetical protein
MSESRPIVALIQEHKSLFIIIMVGLFLLELEIFALAAVKSGRKSWLQVMDQHGNLIHETDGRQLSEFNKYYFEKTFGPIENFQVRLQSKDVPFPFRAWFVAAVGLPLGLILLFGFIVRAYLALFYGDKWKDRDPSGTRPHESRLEMALDKVSRLNIFIIGFLILVGVLAYWILPNFITYLGRTGIETVIRFKWVFLGLAAILVVVAIWIIYLRYLLAKKSIETQADLDKYRLQLEFQPKLTPPIQIKAASSQSSTQSLPGWTEGNTPEEDRSQTKILP